MKTLLLLMLLAIPAFAQNQQTIIKTSADYGMKCDGNNDDTQRFLNALGTGGGTINLYIVFVNGVCNIGWVNPITVPNYVTLDFTQQGSIFLKSGSTLNVNSAIVDQDYHPIFTGPGTYNISPRNAVTCLAITGGIACQATGAGGLPANPTSSIQFNNSGTFGAISNVAAGSALVSNGAASTPIFQTKQALDVRDFGVDCTDTNDSTTALQNAINTAGNFGKVVFPAKCKVKVSSTPAIFIHDIQGLELEMLGKQGNSCDQGGSSGLDYQQAYSAGNTVISILDSQRLRFRNLVIYANGNADNGILIDQDGSTPPITTDNIFEGTCIYNNTATRNASFNGINLSPTSASNVESQRFRDLVVVCSNSAPTSATSNGNGFSLPGNSNAVNQDITYYNSINCSKTLNSPGGQTIAWQHVLDSTSGSINTNVVMPSLNAGLLFSRFENSSIGVQQVGASPTGPTLVEGNDFTNATTVFDCATNGCGNVTIINNERDSVPANWFNVHGVHANSALFAINNRNFSWSPTDFNLGGFVFPDLPNGGSVPVWTETLPLHLTPRANNNDGGGINHGSPYIDLQNASGSTPTIDDYYIQSMPTGTFTAATSSTLVFGHSTTNGITPWYSFQGTMSGVATNSISTPTNLTISNVCSGGGSTWTYQAVAHDGTGTTAASASASTPTGCLNLANGANRVLIPMVSGCTFFDVYRTAVPGGGTPSTTGKIGVVPCYNIGTISVAAEAEASKLVFNDTGVAGDSTSPPSTNTTGTWVFNKGVNSALYSTVTNCQLGGATGTVSPAACGSAASGSIAIPASQTSYTVTTSAVTVNSHIFVQQITDNSGISSATCNSGATTPIQSSRSAGTNFLITLTSVASVTCIQYWIVN